jgi:hypothetical protein
MVQRSWGTGGPAQLAAQTLLWPGTDCSKSLIISRNFQELNLQASDPNLENYWSKVQSGSEMAARAQFGVG